MTNYMMIQTQGISSSSLRIEEQTTLMMQKKNQGIVTILGNSEGCCETYTTASASSPLRRTLSADMSSKKWLSHHNNMSSSPMKKIASSEELTPRTIANSFSSSSSSSSSEEENYEERKDEFDDAEAERERLEIWSSIQRNKKEEIAKSSSPSSGSGPFETWSSIMSLKGNEISKSLPLTPYVHPLVKRSKSSLSEKSLEICTESLGSETGSDGCLFSSYPPSESEDNNKDTEQQQEEGAYKAEEEYWYNNHAMTHKKSPSPRSFPPPLPSLSLQSNKNGPSLHMRPHRDNGRLVLEAVSLPSQNNFNAQRQDGRLVLTFTNDAADDDDEVEENYHDDDEGVEEFEEEFGGFEEDEGDYYYEGEYDDDDDEEEEEEEEEGVIEQTEVVEVGDVESVMMEKAAPLLSSGFTSSVHRLALMMNNHKPIGLVNRNPNWSEKFNKGVNLEDVSVVEMEPSSMAQSLPQRVARLIPSAASAAAASFNFNAYEYYWKTKPTSESDDKVHNPLAYHQQNNNYSPHKNNYGSKVIVSGDMNQVVSNEQQQLLVLRGKNGDYLVHNLKSCKDSRRPFLFWEPYCIATS